MADSPDWRNLDHAYGKAEDIPRLLEQLSPNITAPVWDDLWSRICHQSTVYSASFPALPYLLEAALRWSPKDRVMPLSLAASIVISDDVRGCREAFMDGLSETVIQCHKLAIETLGAGGLSREGRIYLMEAVLALEGDAVWGQQLDGLAGGELQGACPSCQTQLFIVIGESGFFVTAMEWVKELPERRSSIVAAKPSNLYGAGAWLHTQCMDAGDPELAGWICSAFGSTTCPSCGTSKKIPDLVAHYYEQ